MLRVGDLLLSCDNLCEEDKVTLADKNDKVRYTFVGECLETPEIKNMNVEYFYVFDGFGCVISVKEDL